ncbi:MAG TPA: response regulator [Hyphomicrobium sp.]|jgi:two-component system probable response regulator PhcQ|nr:response regulator [Hyphomicrobium sp.]
MDSFRTDQPVEILIVDDEPQAVKYFKKAFGTKYDVLTATSADEAEALVLSGNHNIGLVITDQRMPGRSGVSLLSRIRAERPDIIRMLTTAYADLDSAIEAVNRGEILRYISKPWDLRVLEAEIDQAITFYLLKNEYDLLLRDKLSAMHRTLLRDRMNGLAVMAGTLPYNNAPLTMYNYLKDALAEPVWRSFVQRQWSQLRVQDHWRIPIDETQRAINLTEDLMDRSLFANDEAGASADIVAITNACADSINEEHGQRHVRVSSDEDSIVIPASPFAIQSIMQGLMEPVSRWAAPGSTMQVNVTCNAEGEAAIQLETRNCEPGKALQDTVLFAPAMQATPKSASDFLKAALAIGHLGGRISSPPMENGYKQIHVNLSTRPEHGSQPAVFRTEWIEDLSSDYEKWVLGTLDIAA